MKFYKLHIFKSIIDNYKYSGEENKTEINKSEINGFNIKSLCHVAGIIINDENVSKMIFEIIQEEGSDYDFKALHPQYHPIKYLSKGILYTRIWEYLTDLDIDKFALFYGVRLELSRYQKIIEIIKLQNKLFQDILESKNDIRDSYIIQKLTQIIKNNRIIIPDLVFFQ